MKPNSCNLIAMHHRSRTPVPVLQAENSIEIHRRSSRTHANGSLDRREEETKKRFSRDSQSGQRWRTRGPLPPLWIPFVPDFSLLLRSPCMSCSSSSSPPSSSSFLIARSPKLATSRLSLNCLPWYWFLFAYCFCLEIFVIFVIFGSLSCVFCDFLLKNYSFLV